KNISKSPIIVGRHYPAFTGRESENAKVPQPSASVNLSASSNLVQLSSDRRYAQRHGGAYGKRNGACGNRFAARHNLGTVAGAAQLPARAAGERPGALHAARSRARELRARRAGGVRDFLPGIEQFIRRGDPRL